MTRELEDLTSFSLKEKRGPSLGEDVAHTIDMIDSELHEILDYEGMNLSDGF